MKRSLALPDEMRSELKVPIGALFEGEPRENIARLRGMIGRLRPPMLATVGDFVSKNVLESGLDPDIVVVDHRIMRSDVEPLDLEGRVKVMARNPRGTIDADAWRALGDAVTLKKGVAVIVEGEEDLLVLPLISLAPLGSLIIYGQPGAGMVAVEVTEEQKGWAEGFMERMERS